MKIKAANSIVVVVLLVGMSALAGVNGSLPITSGNTSFTRMETVTFSVAFPNLHIEENVCYSTIETDENMQYLACDGFPMLPYKTEMYKFPISTRIDSVTIDASAVQTIKLQQDLQFSPQTNPYTTESMKTETLNCNIPHDEIGYYPSDWCLYSINVGLDGNTRTTYLSLQLFPARYNSMTGELAYVSEMTIEVVYELPQQSLFTGDAYDLVIIAPEAFSSALQPLITHKEQYGTATKLVTLGEVYDGTYFNAQGRDDAEKIKYFIKNAIEEWGIMYVLLVGGRHGGYPDAKWWCPTRYTNLDANDGDTQFLSDLYFADIYRYENGTPVFDDWDPNGNDLFGEWNFRAHESLDMYPDVALGRWPCRTTFEVDVMVEKTLVYETTAYGQEWARRYVGLGGDTFPGDQWYDGEATVINVTEYLTPLGLEFDTLFLSDGTLEDGNDIINAISEGCGFLQFEGHGTPTSWATHKPQSEEWDVFINELKFPSLKNKDMYPICVVGGCSNSKFDVTILTALDLKNISANINHGSIGLESFDWWMTRKVDGGSVATIGCTSYGYGKSGDSDHDGIFDGIQYRGGFIDIEFFRVIAQEGKDILGAAHAGALTNYLLKFSPITDRIDGKTVEEWALFGDPSLKIGGYP